MWSRNEHKILVYASFEVTQKCTHAKLCILRVLCLITWCIGFHPWALFLHQLWDSISWCLLSVTRPYIYLTPSSIYRVIPRIYRITTYHFLCATLLSRNTGGGNMFYNNENTACPFSKWDKVDTNMVLLLPHY